MNPKATLAEYDLGDFVSSEPVSEGNAWCYKVSTGRGDYFVKSLAVDQGAPACLLFEVARRLNDLGVRQATMHRTKSGQLLSSDRCAVFELLLGQTRKTLSDRQFESCISHLARYNGALAGVPLHSATATIAQLTACTNPWRKASSLDFLLDSFQPDLNSLSLSDSVRQVSFEALALLTEVRENLDLIPKQLIHADIGPGNILFDGDDVVAFLDLTPEYGTHLYSLSMFLFWHCLYYSDHAPDVGGITLGFRIYAEHHPVTPLERDCEFPLLVKAVAFRLFSRIIANREKQTFSPQSIDRMAHCMRTLLDVRSQIETGA